MRWRELLVLTTMPLLLTGAAPDGEVTLPLSDYEALVKAVAAPEPPAEPSPALSAATLAITAGEATASAELRFSARSERAKPAELSLGADWPAESRTVTPETAILARRGNAISLLLPGAGAWQVTMRATIPVERAGELSTFRLPVPGFSAVEGTLAVGFPNAEVKLDGGTILSRRTEGSRTIVRFAASAGELAATIRAAGGKKNGPLKFGAASIDTEEHVEETFLRATSAVRIALESGRTDSVVFAVPRDCDVLSVRGDAVASFEAKNGTLTVRLGRPATAESPGLHLQIALSRKFEPGRFQPPFPVFPSTATYMLAFYPSETLELSMEEPGAFEDAELSEAAAGGIVEGADEIVVARAVRAPAPPTYAAEKRKEWKVLALTIPEARFTTVASERGDVVTAAEYLVQTRSKTALRVVLPAGAEFWEADERGRPIAAGRSADGGLLLPLSSITTRNRVRILYRAAGSAWKAKQKIALALPWVAAPVSRASWAVTLPDPWEVSPAKDSPWRESGAPAELASDSAESPESGADSEFIEKNRGEAAGSRIARRGVVVPLPSATPRRFSASLVEGTPPELVLELKGNAAEGEWR